jgi:hypothetical protein
MDPMIEIDAGETVWRFDRGFMTSNWTCIWGRGCRGILAESTEHLGHGCCSIGADLGDLDEAMSVSACAALLRPDEFEHHAAASAGGIFSDDTRLHTRVVDGACIFLNSPTFPGGAGCALHLAARRFDESPIDWKPSVCWQLPVHVDWQERDEQTEIATVRGWTRADWGDDGRTMAWCCTERSAARVGSDTADAYAGSDTADAYVGTDMVVDSLADELVALVGETVYVELRRRIGGDDASRSTSNA